MAKVQTAKPERASVTVLDAHGNRRKLALINRPDMRAFDRWILERRMRHIEKFGADQKFSLERQNELLIEIQRNGVMPQESFAMSNTTDGLIEILRIALEAFEPDVTFGEVETDFEATRPDKFLYPAYDALEDATWPELTEAKRQAREALVRKGDFTKQEAAIPENLGNPTIPIMTTSTAPS